jgi:hypothetical protein
MRLPGNAEHGGAGMKTLRVCLPAISILALAWPAGAEPRLPADRVMRMPVRNSGRRLTPAGLVQLIRWCIGEDARDDPPEAEKVNDPLLASADPTEVPGLAEIAQRIMTILTKDGRRRDGRLWGTPHPTQPPKRVEHLIEISRIVAKEGSAPAASRRESHAAGK